MVWELGRVILPGYPILVATLTGSSSAVEAGTAPDALPVPDRAGSWGLDFLRIQRVRFAARFRLRPELESARLRSLGWRYPKW